MTRKQQTYVSTSEIARAMFLAFAFAFVTLTMSMASARGEPAREPAAVGKDSSARVTSSSRTKSNFVNVCEKKIKANVRGKKERANSICTCIVNNLAKKLDDSRLEIITKSYQGRIDLNKIRKTYPDIDITLEFEMDVAESCLEDSKYEIGVEG
jgi:hypothetical protein